MKCLRNSGGARPVPPPSGFADNGPAMRIASFTVFALAAFAANSLLGRLALGGNAIDAASYTAIRIASGAAALLALALLAGKKGSVAASGSWPSALALFLYA